MNEDFFFSGDFFPICLVLPSESTKSHCGPQAVSAGTGLGLQSHQTENLQGETHRGTQAHMLPFGPGN